MENKRKHFILLVLATIGALLVLGYFFALKKSEPEYLSKIDRIMFDQKNKSPKYILTLPDKNEVQNKATEKTSEPFLQKEDNEKPLAAVDLLNSIPLISKLTPIKDPKPLNVIDLDSSMSEKEGDLLVPKVADNGTRPWIKYGKMESVQPNFYKVAVVLKNIGMDFGITEAAITAMPSNVSLSFSPYTIGAADKIKQARINGHETYADLLLSSRDVLKSDNGPLAMSLTISPQENVERMKKALALGAPIGGMIINDGVADKDNRDQIIMLLDELKSRGELVIDATSGNEINTIKLPGLARKKADVIIDKNFDRETIDAQLKKAEEIAKTNGQVLVVAASKPVVMNAISEWLNTFSQQLTYQQIKEGSAIIQKPLALVPVSNLVVE